MDAIIKWLTEAKLFGVSAYVWVAAALAAAAVLIVLLALLRGRKRRKGLGRAAMKESVRTIEPQTVEARLSVANVHGIGRRSYQQDAFAVSPLSDAALCKRCGVLLALADGMGGMTDGGKASAIVIETLLSGFSAEAAVADPSVALASLLYRANHEVKKLDNSGSTAIGAIVRGNMLYFASCGDSRIALCRGGALITLNREQNYAALLDDRAARGDISYEEALCDPQRHALTSYVGGAQMKVDRGLAPIELRGGDVLVLMSDGIFNALSEEELCTCLKSGLYEAAERMEKLILGKNLEEQDNFTAILAGINL